MQRGTGDRRAGVDESPVDLHCVEQPITPREQECELLDPCVLYIGTSCVAEGFVELAEHDIEEMWRNAGALFEISAEGENSARHPRKVLPDAVVDEESGNPVGGDAFERIFDVYAEAAPAVPMMLRIGNDGTLIAVCRCREVRPHHAAEWKVERAQEDGERQIVLQSCQVLARCKADAFVALLAVPNMSRPMVRRIPKNLLEQRNVNGFLLTPDVFLGIATTRGIQPTKLLERKGSRFLTAAERPGSGNCQAGNIRDMVLSWW